MIRGICLLLSVRESGLSATWLIKNGQQVGCGELAPRAKVNLEISEAQWPTWNSDTALVDVLAMLLKVIDEHDVAGCIASL